MARAELTRSHQGAVTVYVEGVPIDGAVLTGVDWSGQQQVARIAIPLDKVVFAEQRNIVPFVRPTERAA